MFNYIKAFWNFFPARVRGQLRPYTYFLKTIIGGGRCIPISVEGKTFYAAHNTDLELKRIKIFPSYEGRFTSEFANSCRQAKTIVDIGANIGLYAILASKVNPSARVYALEPMPENLTALEYNVSINNLHNITPLSLAVGARNSYGSIEASNCNSAGEGGGQVVYSDVKSRNTVTVRTLDYLWQEGVIGFPDLVLMDIEGFEFEALQGMKKILGRGYSEVFVEVHKELLAEKGVSLKDIDDFMCQFDYRKEILKLPDHEKGGHKQTHVRYIPSSINALD